jgi:hypothetical protein
MGLGRRQDDLARPRQQHQGDLVGHGRGRHDERILLAEHRGEVGFQRPLVGVLAQVEGPGPVAGGAHRRRHRRRRTRQQVAAEIGRAHHRS